MSATDTMDSFDRARRALDCYDCRVQTHEVLSETSFMTDETIVFVHVNNFERLDRFVLKAFDAQGVQRACDTIYNDAGRRLALAPEFSHYYTDLQVPRGSDLSKIGEDGWIINVPVLRSYDPVMDRRHTQKAMVLAHLGEMLGQDDVRSFIFNADPGSLVTPAAAKE